MFAQILLLDASMLPILVFIKKKAVVAYIIAVISAALCLSAIDAGAYVRSLYADLPLPMLTLSGYYITHYYKNEIENRWNLLLPVLCFLVIVKNSSIYYIGLLVIQLAVAVFARRKLLQKKQLLQILLLSVCAPIFLLIIWNRHVLSIAEWGMTSRHALSLENIKLTLYQKTAEMKLQTVREFFQNIGTFSIMKNAVGCFCLSGYIAISGAKLRNPSAFPVRSYILTVGIVYTTYMAGLLGMYLGNMPGGTLGSFERYESIIHVFIFGIAALFAIEQWNAAEGFVKWRKGFAAILLAPFIVLAAFNGKGICSLLIFPTQGQEETERLTLTIDNIRLSEPPPTIYAASTPGISNIVGRVIYSFYPESCHIIEPKDISDLDSWTENSEYMMICNADDTYVTYATKCGIDPTVMLWNREEFLAARLEGSVP